MRSRSSKMAGRLLVITHTSALAEALSGAGYDVYTATADDARAWMPGMDATTVLMVQLADVGWIGETIRALRATGRRAPVVAFVPDPGARERLEVDCGDDEHLVILGLPLSYDRLIAAVAE